MVVHVRKLPRLPERDRAAHKGDFGRVLVIAGSPGMTGAGCMAAVAAQRAGAGLVTLALPASLNPIAEAKLTSAMSRPLPEPNAPVLGPEAAQEILGWADEFDVMALGPGLGGADVTRQAVRRLVAELELPLVVDADGLNALAGDTDVLSSAAGGRILTPHPGEMARLRGEPDTSRVMADRAGTAFDFAQRFRAIVALKGWETVVTDGHRLYVNVTGNPGMASGGTGDVLTGMAAGLLCQGLNAFDALRLAVFVHGLAGDLAAEDQGELSLVAEDLLDRVPEAFQMVGGGGQAAGRAAVQALLARRGRRGG